MSPAVTVAQQTLTCGYLSINYRTMASNGVSIPCFWPGCQRRSTGLGNLASHLEWKHRVTDGFGCHHCGFKHLEREVTRSHIQLQHRKQEDPPKAALALARHYRKRYEVHTREVHAHEVHAGEIHAHEVHAREIHAHEVHTCEMQDL